MLPNMGYYVQAVDRMVKETEEIGETMHPKYQVVREAIDQNKTADLSTEELTEISELFKEGTKKYQLILKKISQLSITSQSNGNPQKF